MGKEYYKDELIFEGEYLDGTRWNGKGKEYNGKDELFYDGEYPKGERWNGKGKEYMFNEIMFDGEYLNGKNEKAIETNFIMMILPETSNSK